MTESVVLPLVTATVTPAIAVSGYAASSALDTFENMPSFLEIDPLMLPTEFYRKDSAGNDTLMAQFYDQNRVPVSGYRVLNRLSLSENVRVTVRPS